MPQKKLMKEDGGGSTYADLCGAAPLGSASPSPGFFGGRGLFGVIAAGFLGAGLFGLLFGQGFFAGMTVSIAFPFDSMRQRRRAGWKDG